MRRKTLWIAAALVAMLGGAGCCGMCDRWGHNTPVQAGAPPAQPCCQPCCPNPCNAPPAAPIQPVPVAQPAAAVPAAQAGWARPAVSTSSNGCTCPQ